MARRKRSNGKKTGRPSRLFITFLFAVFILILGFYILSLPIWQIKEVVVNGARMLSPDEIRTMAAVPVSENLFLAGLGRARENLKKITAIKSFSFYRIPPGTVLINITERRPLATIVLKDRSIIIDRHGYIINRNPNLTLNIPNQADLPVVSGVEQAGLDRAEQVDPAVSALIAEIIDKLAPYLESKRMQLELGGLRDINLLLDDILRVKVGEAANVREKMAVFRALLKVISGRWDQVEYVDVRFPDNPVIKYK
ncbi:MAG: FtsQ-type POTRA domain-containing protein [Candidatus Saganbacteria bacterium]|nr:FtsQ-type POTRA domain-containing protein [Candidatus Saganbacteria bacterium]